MRQETGSLNASKSFAFILSYIALNRKLIIFFFVCSGNMNVSIHSEANMINISFILTWNVVIISQEANVFDVWLFSGGLLTPALLCGDVKLFFVQFIESSAAQLLAKTELNSPKCCNTSSLTVSLSQDGFFLQAPLLSGILLSCEHEVCVGFSSERNQKIWGCTLTVRHFSRKWFIHFWPDFILYDMYHGLDLL